VIEYGMVLLGVAAGPSQLNQRKTFPVEGMELSSDESVDVEGGLDQVSFNDVMDVADRAVDQFEEELVASRVSDLQSRKQKAPVFLDESSEMEYSSSSESSIPASLPPQYVL